MPDQKKKKYQQQRTSTKPYFMKDQVWYWNSIQFLSYPISYSKRPYSLWEYVRTQYSFLSLEHPFVCGELHVSHSLRNVSGATPLGRAVLYLDFKSDWAPTICLCFSGFRPKSCLVVLMQASSKSPLMWGILKVKPGDTSPTFGI